MVKTIQQFLSKYHKQSLIKDNFSKEAKHKLSVVNQHEPIFSINNEMDAILLDVYYTSTQNKEALQKAFEDARNNVFDIWPNLNNTQKNHLLHVECQSVYESLPSFVNHDTRIYVAFFDELFNSLFDKRPVVFELEQFFKLYKTYKDSVIDIKDYNHFPFMANFSECYLISQKDEKMMLYHPKAKVLFEITNFSITKRFALDIQANVSIESIEKFAQFAIDDNIQMMKQWLIDETCLNKRALKATKRKSFDKISEV